MVPVKPMQIDIVDIGDQSIRLQAPLSVHVNDKGNAFGGSLGSVMTLACWGLLTAWTRGIGLDCDVYVAKATTDFLKPVEEDLDVTAWFVDPEALGAFRRQLKAKGRAKITLASQTTLSSGIAGARQEGQFVAFVRDFG